MSEESKLHQEQVGRNVYLVDKSLLDDLLRPFESNLWILENAESTSDFDRVAFNVPLEKENRHIIGNTVQKLLSFQVKSKRYSICEVLERQHLKGPRGSNTTCGLEVLLGKLETVICRFWRNALGIVLTLLSM